jgi:hypothetical protein
MYLAAILKAFTGLTLRSIKLIQIIFRNSVPRKEHTRRLLYQYKSVSVAQGSNSFVVRISRDSSVGMATGYKLDDRSSIPGWGKEVFLYSVQIGSAAHPCCYPMCTTSSFPVGKAARASADHSSPSSVEVMNLGAMHTLPHTSSWHGT